MTDGKRDRLRTLYKQKIAQAVNSAIEGADPVALKSAVDEAAVYSKLLSAMKTPWAPHWTAALTVAVICLAIASILWSTKVKRSNVSMTVETESLRGTLARDWRVEAPFQAPVMHLEDLSVVEAPNLGLRLNEKTGDAWFKLEGGQITLQNLQIDNGASLQMTSDKAQLSVFVTLKPLRGRLAVLGKGKLTAGVQPGNATVRRDYDLDIPEIIDFSATDPKGVPARFTVHSPQKWNLGRIPFNSLGFALEEMRDISESQLVSGIKSGSVRFNDTSWPPLDLYENQIVSAHNTGSARIELRSGEGAVHVTLNGLVKDVTIGDSQASEGLAPSYLEYLYNKKSLTLFWGAMVFAWGVLWGIRKTLFR